MNDLKHSRTCIDDLNKENMNLKEKIEGAECMIETLRNQIKEEKEKNSVSLSEEKDRTQKMSVRLRSLQEQYENLNSQQNKLVEQVLFYGSV